MKYFLNGTKISYDEAEVHFLSLVSMAGLDPMEGRAVWKRAHDFRDEDDRAFATDDISNVTTELELVPEDSDALTYMP